MSRELLFQIALTQISGIGPRTAKKLVSYCGGIEAIFQASKKSLMSIPSIGPQTAELIKSSVNLDPAKQELEFIKKHNIQPLFYLDQQYPQRLLQYEDAPILLYFKGNTNLNPHRTVGIIGTRKPSQLGLSKCSEIVSGLKAYNPTIISGLAYGIDIQAHRTSVREGIPTIGVLGHGLDRMYPFAHRQTAKEMTLNGGLLSEFTSGTLPDRENFPMRNRIVAALSDALIVVESAESGGSLITADFANQYHKDVFAVPGRISDPLSAGCNFLIKTHQAALLEHAGDIAYVLGWSKPGSQITQATLFEPLNPAEQEIVDFLRVNNETDFDLLAIKTKKSASQLSTLLLEMEFKGILKSIPGNRVVLL